MFQTSVEVASDIYRVRSVLSGKKAHDGHVETR